jgi:PAS domain S-box-containing protein
MATSRTSRPYAIDRSLRGRRTPLILALCVLALSLAVTFVAWRVASEELADSTQSEFDFQVRQTVRSIEQRMATYEQVQRGVRAFLLGSTEVRSEDFRLYVAALDLADKFPGIQGIALVSAFGPGQLDARNAAMRASTPPFALHPAGERAQYSAIIQIEPFTGLNPRALGFDMLSEPIRREAMERARDSGAAAASGKLRLIQENGRNEQSGLVMYLPVYGRDLPLATREQRRASLIGWVGAPFRMGDLMAGLGGERERDVLLSIYDGVAATPEALLYQSAGAATLAGHRPRFQRHRKVLIAGRPWTLEIGSSPLLESRLASDRPRTILVVGIAASALFGLLFWSLATGRRRAVRLAGEATAKLRESEFRWKYALEGAGDGVFDWDRGSNTVLYSRRWKAMLGYQEQELPDTPAVWEELLHPDEAAQVLAILGRYTASTDQSYEAEYRMRCKDGSWKWIRGRGMAVTRDAAGLPLRTIGTHTDITRLKENEAALRASNAQLAAEQHRGKIILEHSHDAFIAVAPDGLVTDWSAKAEALLGWRAEHAVGRDLAELIVPEPLRGAHNAGFRRFVQTGQGTLARSVIEVNAQHRNGSLIPVELAIAGFPQADGGYAVSAFMRDISERKKAQRLEAERTLALDEARNALQHAQRLEAVGKLTGGIAHDFNNVLHIIGGNVQLMQVMNAGNERMEKRLKSMQSAVDRGAKLSSQLLSFARRQPLQPVVVNLQRTLQGMDDLLQRALGESVQIAFDTEDGLWNTQIDRGQLENVVLNLAINARDAMPDGGQLTIALRNTTVDPAHVRRMVDFPAGDYVRLSLTDTGSGMTPEVRAVAFEPFFTTKPVGQGTGLGLSMAYGFVMQSGGHIELNSEPGQGTAVIIYLPRSHQHEAPGVVVADPAAQGGSETILVVEDDQDVRATAVNTLAGLGYQVLQAEDGAAALRQIEAGAAIDVLFTDVVMPGPVSSTELAARARTLLPALAVLFTSGYTRNALTTDGRLDAGVTLLGKPYRREELARKIREVLAAR